MISLLLAALSALTHIAAGTTYSSLAAQQVLASPFPYEFPQNATFPMEKCHGITVEEITIDQLQAHYKSGKLNVVKVVECYEKRIWQTDGYINAVMEFNPDAYTIAALLDSERKAKKVRGPLHGVPFLIKENIATKDKMETTAGSLALVGSVVPRDAHVVSLLREAGALLLGKATLSEWADMRSNTYSEGYSARGGQARSPYNLTINPGGSSTGSGASVAANQAVFALGTETDGSVINPAMRNSIVGVKPSVGRTSRAGVIPESSTQDSVGVLARTVKDAATVFAIISGKDPRDNYTLVQPSLERLTLASKSQLKDFRLGVPWETFWTLADAAQRADLTALLSHLSSQGAKIVNGTEIPTRAQLVDSKGWNWDFGGGRGYANESEYTVVKADFYNDIKAYLSELENTKVRTLEDIVRFNVENTGVEGGVPGTHPAFESGQDGFLAALKWGGRKNETYWQARNFVQTKSGKEGIDAALKAKGGVDALLVPPNVAQSIQVAAMAGYPVVTVPAGNHENGMGYGLAVVGTMWDEARLVRIAAGIEDAVKGTRWGRRLPKWKDLGKWNVPTYWE